MLKVRYKIKTKNLIFFEIIYILFIKFFIDVFNVPETAWYLCDIINVVLFLLAFKKIINTFSKIKANRFLVLIMLFLALTFLGHLINGGSILLYLWGLRNIGRMFVFWINCIVILNKEDVEKIFKILYIAFILNFIISIFQFSILGIKGDNLGGIFGTKGSSNSFSLNLIVIVTTWTFIRYLDKDVSTIKLVLCMGIAVVLATLTELKSYYILMVILVILALILQKKLNFRSIVILFFLFLGVMLAGTLLEKVFPDSVQYFTIEGMTEYLTGSGGVGYSSTDDLSRTGAVSTIHEIFFEGDIIKEIFGFGLGNCEASSISIFNSSFYNRYEYLHYRWFFHAMTYIELGFTGILWFIIFAITMLIYVLKRADKNNKIEYNVACLTVIMIIYSLIIACYNSSLRIESGYLIYFILASSFILFKYKLINDK